jgi:hypothetical protein
MTTEIAAIEAPQQIARQVDDLKTQAASLQITDQVSLDQAAEMRLAAVGMLKRIAEVFDPIDRAQIEARRVTIAQRKALEDPATFVKDTLGRRMAEYDELVKRQRREAEEAAQRERDRLEREAAAAAEAERVRLQSEADQRAIDAAAAAEAAGDTELAERIIAAPPVVEAPPPKPVFMPPVAAPRAAVAAGTSFRDNYRAEITNLMALVRAIAAGTQPLALVLPNQVALNGLARSLKDAMAVPGVRAVNDRTTAQRS